MTICATCRGIYSIREAAGMAVENGQILCIDCSHLKTLLQATLTGKKLVEGTFHARVEEITTETNNKMHQVVKKYRGKE